MALTNKRKWTSPAMSVSSTYVEMAPWRNTR